MNQVLIVDDSTVIRRLVEVCLKPIQVDVITASTGAEALAALEDEDIDMLILDVGLPDTTGWEILSFVRDHDRLADLPVIIMTGYSESEREDRPADRGPDGYLLKPFSPEDLRRIVLDTIHGLSSAAV